MRRHILGLISAVSLVVGIVLIMRYGLANANAAAGICIRGGLMMGAIWLALPQLSQLAKRLPMWLVGSCLVAMGILICRPRLFLVLWPVLPAIAAIQFFGWLIKPPPHRKTKARAGRPKQSKT